MSKIRNTLKSIVVIFIFVFLCLMATSCNNSGEPSTEPKRKQNSLPPEKKVQSRAEEILENMSLEEKIGQLFMVRPESLCTKDNIVSENNTVTEIDITMVDTMKRYPVGGVVFFGKNILSPTQLKAFVSDISASSKIPLFMGVDEEGGSVARIANTKGFNVKKYNNMAEIGKTNEEEKAKEVGITLGTYIKEYGFNLDFAPVADINTNSDNKVIGKRSFGHDPLLVSKMVNAEIAGFHEANIMSCIKHFPGHGDTKGDTHQGYVSIDKTWDELKSCELIPFINSIAITDMVMVAHITTPNITSNGLPASLSKELIEDGLRKELGYEGVVITDSLEMGAISQKYSSSESAIKAILAGVDILLMPGNYIQAYEGVYEAVQNGAISNERIDESVLRILNLKIKYNLIP